MTAGGRLAELVDALAAIVADARDEGRADMRDSVDEQLIELARQALERWSTHDASRVVSEVPPAAPGGDDERVVADPGARVGADVPASAGNRLGEAVVAYGGVASGVAPDPRISDASPVADPRTNEARSDEGMKSPDIDQARLEGEVAAVESVCRFVRDALKDPGTAASIWAWAQAYVFRAPRTAKAVPLEVRQLAAIAEALGNTNGDPEVSIGMAREMRSDVDRLSVQAGRAARAWEEDPTSLATENAIRELGLRARPVDHAEPVRRQLIADRNGENHDPLEVADALDALGDRSNEATGEALHDAADVMRALATRPETPRRCAGCSAILSPATHCNDCAGVR